MACRWRPGHRTGRTPASTAPASARPPCTASSTSTGIRSGKTPGSTPSWGPTGCRPCRHRRTGRTRG
eukprot:302424-Prymnesium_polylepis.1